LRAVVLNLTGGLGGGGFTGLEPGEVQSAGVSSEVFTFLALMSSLSCFSSFSMMSSFSRITGVEVN